MIFLVMGAALSVLGMWSLVATPRVIRRFPNPRIWLWWACWLMVAGAASPALIAQGFEAMGWTR